MNSTLWLVLEGGLVGGSGEMAELATVLLVVVQG